MPAPLSASCVCFEKGSLTCATSRDTLRHMKTITIRELHARTGRWVREAAQHGQILVTDNGRTIAKLVPESLPAEVPYFARRRRSRAFAKLDDSGKVGKGTDSTTAISEDRDDAL